MQEMWVRSQSQGRFRQEGNGNPFQHSHMEKSLGQEPGGLQSMELQRVWHDLAARQQTQSQNKVTSGPLYPIFHPCSDGPGRGYGWVLWETLFKVKSLKISLQLFRRLKILHSKYGCTAKQEVQFLVLQSQQEGRGWPGSGTAIAASVSPFGSSCDCCVHLPSKKGQALDKITHTTRPTSHSLVSQCESENVSHSVVSDSLQHHRR